MNQLSISFGGAIVRGIPSSAAPSHFDWTALLSTKSVKFLHGVNKRHERKLRRLSLVQPKRSAQFSFQNISWHTVITIFSFGHLQSLMDPLFCEQNGLYQIITCIRDFADPRISSPLTLWTIHKYNYNILATVISTIGYIVLITKVIRNTKALRDARWYIVWYAVAYCVMHGGLLRDARRHFAWCAAAYCVMRGGILRDARWHIALLV